MTSHYTVSTSCALAAVVVVVVVVVVVSSRQRPLWRGCVSERVRLHEHVADPWGGGGGHSDASKRPYIPSPPFLKRLLFKS